MSTGPRAHITGMLGGMADADCEVTSFLAGNRSPTYLTDERSDQRMVKSSLRGYVVDVARLLSNPLLGVAARRTVGKIDVLYERQATMQSLGWYRRRSTPWVIESNGPFWYEADTERGSLKLKWLARWLEVNSYRSSDLVVCVSEALKQILVREAGVDSRKIVVIPNAVDPSRFSYVKPAPWNQNGPLVIGFIGYLTQWAGLDTLLTAIAQVRTEGLSVQVRIAGQGPETLQLQELSRQLGLSDSVDFLGLRAWTEIPAFLGGCHIGYSGQRRMRIGEMYHSPLKLYEYQAAGLPILASNFPDAQSLIEPTGAGWLFDGGDSDSLAIAIHSAYDQGSALASLGEAGRRNIASNHSWASRVRYLLDELRSRGLLTPAVLP
jgi:glycosyltransferase involved in cell wall biosynthesis